MSVNCETTPSENTLTGTPTAATSHELLAQNIDHEGFTNLVYGAFKDEFVRTKNQRSPFVSSSAEVIGRQCLEMENKFVDKCGFDLVLYPSEPDKLETASGALCSTIKEAVGMGWLDKAVINAKSFQDAERHTSEHWNGMFESAATRIGDQPRQHVELSATDTASKIFFDTVLWGMMHGYKKPEEEDLLSTSALSHPGRALSRLFDLTMEFAREEHLVPGAIISECAQGGATAVESMADKVNRVIVSVAKEGMARGILSPTLLSEKSHEGFVQDNLRAGQDTVNALKKLESMQGRTGSEAP